MTTPHEFRLNGGHPVLDFVNTVEDWTVVKPRDYLHGFADAVRFAEAVGLVTSFEAHHLKRAGDTLVELARLRRVREVLERILRTSIDRRPLATRDLSTLRHDAIEATRASEFKASHRAWLTQRIPVKSGTASALRLRIVVAATTLFLSPPMRHVKACPTCGWFFLDVSKNQSRVWCSMDTCGARAKAGRYYRRKKRSRASSR